MRVTRPTGQCCLLSIQIIFGEVWCDRKISVFYLIVVERNYLKNLRQSQLRLAFVWCNRNEGMWFISMRYEKYMLAFSYRARLHLTEAKLHLEAICNMIWKFIDAKHQESRSTLPLSTVYFHLGENQNSLFFDKTGFKIITLGVWHMHQHVDFLRE